MTKISMALAIFNGAEFIRRQRAMNLIDDARRIIGTDNDIGYPELTAPNRSALIKDLLLGVVLLDLIPQWKVTPNPAFSTGKEVNPAHR